ncbi:MAG: outer membrane beta-barrel protein [Bacteroidales bacterium]|nr:outer membrane beta-barrel protein [Bacteroidales bacterium]
MKKLYFLLPLSLLIFFITPTVQSQEGDVYVSIGAGASIPLSDYANTDFSDEASGFAMVGGNFNINFGYRFNEYFSASGLLSGCVNRYDYIELQNWLTQEFAEDLPDTRWVVESKNWGIGGLMAGVTGTLPLVSNSLFFEARLLGGFMYAYSPAIYVTGKETDEEDKVINIEQASASSWVLDAGAGFRYNRTRKQYFILFADYMHSNPTFNNVRTNTNMGVARDESFSQQISNINISIGIGYIVN